MGSARDSAGRDPTLVRGFGSLELSGAEQPDAAEERNAGPSTLEYVRALPQRDRVAVAVASGVLVVACFIRFGFTGRAAVDAVFAATLVLLAAIDLDCRRLPNGIVLPALAVVLIAQIALFPGRTVEWIAAALGAALFFFLPMLFYPAGIGMGDVKLAALLGAALGKAVIDALFVGILAGGVVAGFLLVTEGARARKRNITYGPFLVLGGLVALFLGGR